MGRYKAVEWLLVFREREYFEIIARILNYCQEKKGITVFADHSILKVDVFQGVHTFFFVCEREYLAG